MPDIEQQKEEDAIYFEHGESYKSFTDRLREIWLEKIFTSEQEKQGSPGKELPSEADQKAVSKREQEPEGDYLDLLDTIGKSLELLKLYTASGITLCTEEGKQHKIPEELLADIRRKGFLALTTARTKEEMRIVSKDVSDQLKKAYIEYNMERYSHLVRSAIEIIHKSRFKKASASIIAAEAGIDRTYLAKAFKQETGQTLTEYIRNMKMRQAADMMCSGNYQLGEISELLGYSDYTYFSKLFKNYYGKAPEEYRKKIPSK